MTISLYINATPLLLPRTGIRQYTLSLLTHLERLEEIEPDYFYLTHWSDRLINAESGIGGSRLWKLKNFIRDRLPYSLEIQHRTRGANRRETRREWLERMLSVAVAAPVAARVPAFASSTSGKSERSKLSMPGPFPGRVISVADDRCIVSGQYQSEPVQAMMRRGMVELTGAPDWVAAWRMFVQPGEVVGIKLNPVSLPWVISSPVVVREIIAGLESAGIRRKDVVIYDRYKSQFLEAGFDKWVPEGVRSAWATDYDDPTGEVSGLGGEG